jgi:hypothetical protein
VIRTITVEREYGAGGGVIAKKLADRLGWKLWDQALTSEIARVANVDQSVVERMDERCDSLFYRLMKVFMRGSMEQSLAVRGMDHFDADSMVEFMQRVISGAASDAAHPSFCAAGPTFSTSSSTRRSKRKSAGCAKPAKAKSRPSKRSKASTGSA